VENKILIHLKECHTGKGKAVSSFDLESTFQISGRFVRRVVHTLRCEGNPICSDENGYYYAANEQELMETICQLGSRISKVAVAKNSLVQAQNLFPDASGQIKFLI